MGGEKRNSNSYMGILKSKGFWATIITTLVVMAMVNRITFLRQIVTGQA